MKVVTQALVAIGGKAQRIREDGIDVPITKSFMMVNDEPLLYWNLQSLYIAGVRRLVLTGDDITQLWEAEIVLNRLEVDFADVKLFLDPGLGVHGLPYQVARKHEGWLDESFIFECGHSLMRPEHYSRLEERKLIDHVVFSAFKPHPSNFRQPVKLRGSSVRPLRTVRRGCSALAHPFLVDRSYIEMLPRLRFDIRRIISYYASNSRLRYVHSDMPAEFDVGREYDFSMRLYRRYLVNVGQSRDFRTRR